jgi:hypothetical protein
MTAAKRELARLGPYVFTEGLFDPAADTLRLGRREEDLTATTTPQGDQVFTEPATGDIVGLVVYRYQERLWEGPIEIPVPTAGEAARDGEAAGGVVAACGRTLFLSLQGNPGSACT